MKRSLVLATALSIGCSFPGEPKYATTAPPALPAAPSKQPPILYIVERSGIETATWMGRGGHNNYRLDFSGKEFPAWVHRDPPHVERTLGDVRSPDDLLAENDYVTLECGWGFLATTSLGSIKEPCASRDRAADTKRASQRVRARLEALAAAAGAVGADAVIDVRCYGLTAPLRLFCEGVAVTLKPS